MDDIDFIIRLGISILCGTVIGFERIWTNRIAGIQTTILVISGSCLFVMTSNFILPSGEAAGRIIGQIISGIGFLGAGMIFKDGFRAHGINSAATIWAVAAIGVMIGLGKIELSLLATLALLITNIIFKVIDQEITNKRKKYDLRLVHNYEINIILLSAEYNDETRGIILDVVGRDKDTKIYSIKTSFDKKDHLKLTICLTTHNLEYEWISKLTKDIVLLKSKMIVDWSQIS